ncbi:IMS domain-containing protein [Candidatus Synechococcus spongiarum]|uniref:IMS domain-containing protein n=1 Tax=Candidatus Synechococcus spongiarum TaxID=431041 RepID=UPI0004716179|nr:IMS domain-containing protein [Candidatus Synechococcus spongiarum]
MERLRNPPPEGQSLDTLDARAEILQASGAFLMDEQRRQAHERQLATLPDESGFPGIELEPGQEMAAPLLLLEAQEYPQAFELALELLSRQEETAPLHSHQQADLLLAASLAARRTSQQMWTKRLYDQSAQVLERAIHVLEGHASQAGRKAILEDDLNKIAPFRILDLLGKESCTARERQRGISSLKALIEQRGGLDADDDEQSSPIRFQDFFKQIRPLLTIDEQLELFEGYSSQKASTATFLLAYTRAAAGFQRRQPAHVDAALAAMEAVDAEGLEPEKACLLLLLGQPDAAQDMVKSCQDPRLCQWLASYESTSDSLLGLCSFCSQWLEKHVLPCYRDVDPRVKVDLDAYFLDPKVQRYINGRDSLPPPGHGPTEGRSHGQTKAKHTKDLDLFTPGKSAIQDPPSRQTGEHEPLPAAPSRWPAGTQASGFPEVIPSPQFSDEFPSASPSATGGDKAVDPAPSGPQRRRRWPLAAKAALVAGAAMVLMVLRPWSRLTTGRTPDSPPQHASSPPPDAAVGNNPAAPPPLANAPILFDRPRIQAVQEGATLDLVGVETLLRAWLDVKAAVLDNSPAAPSGEDTLDALALLAAPELVQDVLNQRQDLRERGEQLQVRSTVGNVSLLSRGPSQTGARAVINYSESTRNAEGITTNTFGPAIIRNDYTFIRGQQGWQLLRFSSSPP